MFGPFWGDPVETSPGPKSAVVVQMHANGDMDSERVGLHVGTISASLFESFDAKM